MSISEICVVYNPQSGRGRARRRLDAYRAALGGRAAFRPTEAAGHAEALAEAAAREGFPVVAAAGGDGTAHEVVNGLLRSGNAEVAFALLPVGSANDYAYSLARADAWADPQTASASCRRVDVGRVESPGRSRYFLNGLGLGFNGAVTLESRRIRFLRGVPLYGLALFTALARHFRCPPTSVTLDGAPRVAPTLALSVNLGRREGNFLVTPRAVLDDGAFDFLHVGALRRWELFRYFPGLVTGHLPANHPALRTGRCRRVAVAAEQPLLVHTDGEFFALPGDGVRELEIRILPKALKVCTVAAA